MCHPSTVPGPDQPPTLRGRGGVAGRRRRFRSVGAQASGQHRSDSGATVHVDKAAHADRTADLADRYCRTGMAAVADENLTLERSLE